MVIAGLPDRIKREFPAYRRHVSRSLLTEIARVNHEPAQLAMWELAKRGGLTVRAAREQRREVAA
jgi:ParB family chromosome partitioning protein